TESAVLQQSLTWFNDWFLNSVCGPVMIAIGITEQPATMADLLSECQRLRNALSQRLPIEGYLALLKRVLILYRRQEAAKVEEVGSKTHHPEVLGKLDERLTVLNVLTRQKWFAETTPLKIPQVGEYIPLQRTGMQAASGGPYQRFDVMGPGFGTQVKREYDEKFSILQAPQWFVRDLKDFRQQADLRNSSTAVAFVDIDD